MKTTVVFLFVIHYITISNTRLLKKVIKQKPVTVISTTTALPVRVRRFLAFDDSVATDSKDEHSDETLFYENNTNYLMKNLPRLSNKRGTRNSNASKFQPVGENKVLVKKPIPNFIDLDDYDLEPKAYRIIPRFIESDEIEDEDFNVDDYDFDIKHDEFAGRGKPLVPRLKDKDKTLTKTTKELNIEGATHPAREKKTFHNKSKTPVSSKQRSTQEVAKSKDKKDEFYDYEITTKNAEKEKAEEGSYEAEERKEFDRIAPRRVRSPWNEIMLPAKVSAKRLSKVPKLIAVLSMFPKGSAQDN